LINHINIQNQSITAPKMHWTRKELKEGKFVHLANNFHGEKSQHLEPVLYIRGKYDATAPVSPDLIHHLTILHEALPDRPTIYVATHDEALFSTLQAAWSKVEIKHDKESKGNEPGHAEKEDAVEEQEKIQEQVEEQLVEQIEEYTDHALVDRSKLVESGESTENSKESKKRARSDSSAYESIQAKNRAHALARLEAVGAIKSKRQKTEGEDLAAAQAKGNDCNASNAPSTTDPLDPRSTASNPPAPTDPLDSRSAASNTAEPVDRTAGQKQSSEAGEEHTASNPPAPTDPLDPRSTASNPPAPTDPLTQQTTTSVNPKLSLLQLDARQQRKASYPLTAALLAAYEKLPTSDILILGDVFPSMPSRALTYLEQHYAEPEPVVLFGRRTRAMDLMVGIWESDTIRWMKARIEQEVEMMKELGTWECAGGGDETFPDYELYPWILFMDGRGTRPDLVVLEPEEDGWIKRGGAEWFRDVRGLGSGMDDWDDNAKPTVQFYIG
jgi:hypothetical protein